MKPVVVFIVCIAIMGCAHGEDECMPPKPNGEKPTAPHDCCNFEKVMPANMKSAFQKCMGSVPHPPKPSGPPPSGGKPPLPPKEIRDHAACMAECVFSENKLIKDDKTIDESALKKFFTPVDKEFKPVVEAAITKCLSSYKNKIDKTLNCTSGAAEFEECALREAIANCPSSAWTSNADCDNLKAMMSKCPDMPIMMGGTHRPM